MTKPWDGMCPRGVAWLAGRFEAERPRLRAVADRLLASTSEADATAAGRRRGVVPGRAGDMPALLAVLDPEAALRGADG